MTSTIDTIELVVAPPLSDHVLVPFNMKDGRKKVRAGWECRCCHEHWDDLPPIRERLHACLVPA